MLLGTINLLLGVRYRLFIGLWTDFIAFNCQVVKWALIFANPVFKNSGILAWRVISVKRVISRSRRSAKSRYKVRNDHRSKFSNLSNWKEEAWKSQGFNGIRTRDLRDTGAMLYQLSYEATHWERGQFIEFISPVRSETMLYQLSYEAIAQLVEHRTGGHRFESRWSLDFFRLLLSNCLNWKIYCDDHSSLWFTSAVQIYELFHIYFTSFHSSREIWTQ